LTNSTTPRLEQSTALVVPPGVHNAGVPQVWPGFCMTFDATAAAFVALVMLARARGERVQKSFSPG
jgi:hypothetical protein